MRAEQAAGAPKAAAAATPNIEIELKLRLNPAHARRLQRNGFFRSLRSRRGSSRHLVSDYYDTDQLALMRREMALRVRHVGSRHIQTLKAAAQGLPGVQTHLEDEAPLLFTAIPDPALIKDVRLREEIRQLAETDKLDCVFTTDFRRITWPACYEGADIEIALDQGEISSNGKAMPLCELELELKGGDPTALQRLALRLTDAIPMQLEHRTKAERGYELYSGNGAKPLKARPVELRRSMTVWQSFVAIATNALSQFRHNADVVLSSNDPEGVHQARVGIRRLRAAFSLYKKALPFWEVAGFREDLGWLQRELGEARDLDVFLLETLRPLQRHSPDDKALADLVSKARDAQAGAWARARRALTDPRTTRVMLTLDLWLQAPAPVSESAGSIPLDQPVLGFAAGRLKRMEKAVRRGVDDPLALPEEELHALRIRIKKLRYAAEFFRSLFSEKKVKVFATAFADLQDHLGALNDALVAKGLLEHLGAPREEGGASRTSQTMAALAGAMVRGWFAARIEHDRSELRETWEHMLEAPRYWEKAARRLSRKRAR